MEKRRYRYLFYGRVQGVGFRYKARHLADRYGLTGFVRNEYDGSVTAEIQGPKTAIGVWMQCLNQDPYIRIDSFERKDLDLREGEECFSVRH
ncbi:MAG: acylphosphatase [Eubacterium sp.]|nr:acylphosphatase [Eubacterium sp.]